MATDTSSSAPLSIPARHQKMAAYLLSLPAEKIHALAHALRAAPITVNPKSLVPTIREVLPDSTSPQNFAMLIAGLYVAREAKQVSVDEFVELLRAGVQNIGGNSLTVAEPDWTQKRPALIDLLNDIPCLAVSSKAVEVLTSHKHAYCHARIFTDIRPIFVGSKQLNVAGGLIIHTLALSYHEDGNLHSFYVALDETDLVELQAVLQRASLKAKEIRHLSENSSIRILPEETN